MQAFTGFDGPWQAEPSFTIGRVARFDESGRLGKKAYAIIKDARQKKAGDDFYGKPVLPGASAIWTTNPVGMRYPDRHPVDPAMRREIAEIYVDYPEQSAVQPELFDFMTSALFDENKHITIAEQELAPAYTKRDLAAEERYKLPDGSTVIGYDELIANKADKRHGSSWRLANAVKALENSFIYGNKLPKDIPDDALRYKEDDKGNITLSETDGGLLTLESSTITLGEVRSWMTGFRDRLQKQNEAFQVTSFAEWIKMKIEIYLKQVDSADKEKARAIFEYFHLLDAEMPDLSDATPITPQRTGYLSPRVPRPLYTEAPAVETVATQEVAEANKPIEQYTTYEVTLENGESVMLRKGTQTLHTAVTSELVMNTKTRFTVGRDDFSFAGTQENDGRGVGSFISEKDLHKIFTNEEIEKGMIEYTCKDQEKDVESCCTSNV